MHKYSNIRSVRPKGYPVFYRKGRVKWVGKWRQTIYEWLGECKWFIYHRLHPGHRYHMIDTGLGYGYHAIDQRILYACFTLLTQYIEARGVSELEEYISGLDSTNKYDAEIHYMERESLELYKWWVEERPEIISKIESCNLDNIDEAIRLEDKLSETDQIMLKRLINIRGVLWI